MAKSLAMAPAKPLSRPATGVLAGLILASLECVALGRISLGLWWVTTSLLLVLGVAVGWICEGQEQLIAHYKWTGWRRHFARSVGSLVATLPAAGPSFEGAFASTLPGAATAALWVPLLGALGLAGALYLWERGRSWAYQAKWRAQPDTVLVALLSVGAAYLEIANRRIKFTEYPDAHTLAITLALVAIYLALRLTAPELPMPSIEKFTRLPRRTKILAMGGALLVNTFLLVWFGLGSPADRLHLANQSMHTRMLVRSVRQVLDLDRDGYSAALNGSDCDELAADRNPGQPEVPDNNTDEDCDGIAAQAPKNGPVSAQNLAQAQELWQNSDVRQTLLKNHRRDHLVLITVDALRADMLDDTPQNRADFPNFFELIDHSAHFVRGFAPAAGTDLSMATLFSGKVNAFAGQSLTLFESLRQKGWKIHGVIPREVLRYAGQTLLTRGLSSYDRVVNDPQMRDVGGLATGRKTTQLGLAALDRLLQADPNGNVGLWVHYFDAHEHDQLPNETLPLTELAFDASPSPIEARYRAATRLVDQGLGTLIEGLRRRKLWGKTLIVLAADHGESLGEDARLPQNHGRFVYNPLVHIPIAIRLPGSAKMRIEAPVGLIDLFPTILELAGVQGVKSDGRSLAPLMVSGAPPDLIAARRIIALNESDQRGLIAWPYKYVRRPVDNYVELFNLQSDFAEQTNLVDDPQHAAALREMAGLLSTLPTFVIDRTRKGRAEREAAAQSFGTH